jgi:hypothetical protein
VKAEDVVITPKLDRMFRWALNALDILGQLKERGGALYIIGLGGDVTGNGISKRKSCRSLPCQTEVHSITPGQCHLQLAESREVTS